MPVLSGITVPPSVSVRRRRQQGLHMFILVPRSTLCKVYQADGFHSKGRRKGPLMEISQLMSAMNMVETDHQLVVEKLQLLKDALGCLMDSDRNPASVVKRIDELSKVIASRFSAHVAQQEIRLFPFLLQNLPEEPDLVAALRKEHEGIEQKSAELSNCLKLALELEEKLPHAVLWDVMTYGWDLWELLDGHAHRETAAIRRCFAKFVQTM
jgi:hypothetical protein